MKKKFTKVTEQNITTIYDHLTRWYKAAQVVEAISNYPTAKWMNPIALPRSTSGKKLTERICNSMKGYYANVKTELDTTLSHKTNKIYPFIRIIYNKEAVGLIQVGDKIRITPTNIFYKEALINDVVRRGRNESKIHIETKVGNDFLETALQQAYEAELFSDMYDSMMDDIYNNETLFN